MVIFRKKSKPKVKLFLIGGFGNQLFQVAYAYTVCRNLSRDLIIYSSSYNNYIRSLEITPEIFDDIRVDIVYEKEGYFDRLIRWFYRGSQYFLKRSPLEPYFGRALLSVSLLLGCIYIFDFKYHNVNFDRLKKFNDIKIYGYFQSSKYISHFDCDIRKHFIKFIKSKSNITPNIVDGRYIVISTRLQDDYVNSYNLNNTGPDYYIENLYSLCEKYDISNIVISSDDYERAKNLFSKVADKNIFYLENFNLFAALDVMIDADALILPNSSYAWWGGYLNMHAQEIVLPKKWFRLASNDGDVYFDR